MKAASASVSSSLPNSEDWKLTSGIGIQRCALAWAGIP